MNKFEFKSKVYKLGFNLKKFAQYINISYNTIKCYSSGANPVPGYMERLLELIEKNQDLEDENQELKDFLQKLNTISNNFPPNSPS